jgi:hypothetical protein
MKSLGRSARGESGSTLIAITMLAFIMLLTAAAVFEFGARDAGLASHTVDRSRALYVAEAGLARGRSWLEAQSDPPTGTDDIIPFGGSPDTLAEGTYAVTIEPDPGNDASSRKYYTIVSQATVGGKTRTLERNVMTQSFAQFIYFTVDEHLAGSVTPVWFATGDHLDGALHTNGQIHIMGDPFYGGHVSSAWGGPDDDDVTHNPAFVYYDGNYWTHLESAAPDNAPDDVPTFQDGYELGTSSIQLPNYVDDIENIAHNGGLTVTGNTEVVLGRLVGGSPMYGYVSYRAVGGSTWTDVPISSFNGVMFITGQVQVSGVLDGSLTLASSNDMYIMDDVVYRNADPLNGPNPDCDDILGLVSESNVIVKDNTANRTNCNIHAHIMALNTSFEVENYRNGAPRGTLTLHGGVIQRYRGAVGTGTLEGGHVVISSGYAKNYHYDSRFNTVQPPGYLMTGRYFMLAWREVSSG